jgi:hypothetical protein
MNEIDEIYHNSFGIAFYWKKGSEVISEKVQLVFRETGFYLTRDQMNQFCKLIEDSMVENASCETCQLKNSCHKFLLKTPCDQIDLAVSMKELKSIKDLVEGSLFKIELEEYVYGAGMN